MLDVVALMVCWSMLWHLVDTQHYWMLQKIFIYDSLFVCVFVCMCVYIYIYIYIYTQKNIIHCSQSSVFPSFVSITNTISARFFPIILLPITYEFLCKSTPLATCIKTYKCTHTHNRQGGYWRQQNAGKYKPESH